MGKRVKKVREIPSKIKEVRELERDESSEEESVSDLGGGFFEEDIGERPAITLSSGQGVERDVDNVEFRENIDRGGRREEESGNRLYDSARQSSEDSGDEKKVYLNTASEQAVKRDFETRPAVRSVADLGVRQRLLNVEDEPGLRRVNINRVQERRMDVNNFEEKKYYKSAVEDGGMKAKRRREMY